jgi:hypothetical protein
VVAERNQKNAAMNAHMAETICDHVTKLMLFTSRSSIWCHHQTTHDGQGDQPGQDGATHWSGSDTRIARQLCCVWRFRPWRVDATAAAASSSARLIASSASLQRTPSAPLNMATTSLMSASVTGTSAKLTSRHRFCDAPTRLEHLANPRRSRRTAADIAYPSPVRGSSLRSNSKNGLTCRTRRDIDEPPSSAS